MPLVTTKWQLHQGSRITKQDPRDFKKLNKMSLKGGSVNARDQYQFRASHDARIPFGGVVEDKPIMLPGEDFTFGKRNRPQTPVGGIIAHYYGETAGSEMQQRYLSQKEMVSNTRSFTLLPAAKDARQRQRRCDPDDPLPAGHGPRDPREVPRETPRALSRHLQAEALHHEHRPEDQHQARRQALHVRQVKNEMRRGEGTRYAAQPNRMGARPAQRNNRKRERNENGWNLQG